MEHMVAENPAYDRTRQFLEDNGVHQEWLDVFSSCNDLRDGFRSSFNSILHHIQRNNMPLIPARNNILRSLSGCGPKDVRVVIVGHDPIGDESLTRGHAFSFPAGERVDSNVGQDRPMLSEKGRSIAVLHDVLVEAGYLERGGCYDCCHEEWAQRGVLMLNASLTWMYGKEHFPIWHGFIRDLLLEVAQLSEQRPLFFLFWGTEARSIGMWLSIMLTVLPYPLQTIYDVSTEIDPRARIVIFIGDHPTYPRDNNSFYLQGRRQFEAIRQVYPDLFNLPNIWEGMNLSSLRPEDENVREEDNSEDDSDEQESD